MNKTIFGNAKIFAQNDIDTDLIIPAKYLTTSDANELGEHALEALGGFQKAIRPIIVVAAKNFGCGSSREHAVWALAGANVQAVIAESFARIFFRNSVNFGLPTFVLADATQKFENGDEVEIDSVASVIHNKTKNEKHAVEPLPEFLQEIVAAGGLLNQI
ncbi:MAG: 3-isopropylmalate dehydratase [Patescibacteria group bacterium]